MVTAVGWVLWALSMLAACATVLALSYIGARYPERIPGPRVIWADWRGRRR